jgi:hypothetical protein
MENKNCEHTRMLHYRTKNRSHTKSIYRYMNCKCKLLHFYANIKFNKTCLGKHLTPKFAKIRINDSHTNPAANRTKEKVQQIMIKNKIKQLHLKTQKINKDSISYICTMQTYGRHYGYK